LNGSSGCGEAGDNGYRQHNGECNRGKPVSPGGGLNVSRFDQDGSDGEGLDEHFDFSRGDGPKIDAFCLGGVSQDCDVTLPDNQDSSDGPADYMEGCFGQVEEERFADYCEADECAADEDFVCEWVENSPEFAGDAEFSCDWAVGDVRESRDDKNGKSDVEHRRPIVCIR